MRFGLCLLRRSVALLLVFLLLLSGTVIFAGAATKYVITPSNAVVTNNGLNADGSAYSGSLGQADSYMYFHPNQTVDGEAFTVSYIYTLPAGTYTMTAGYKSRTDGAQTVALSCDGQVLYTFSMVSSSLAEHTDPLPDLILTEGGSHTFSWTVTAGSSNYLTVGNLTLVPLNEETDTFRFEAEALPVRVVDVQGRSTTVPDESVCSWYWTNALSTTGISGNLSGDLAYYRLTDGSPVGGYLEYTLPARTGLTPGEYTLYWSFRPNSQTYSTVDFSFNGESLMKVSQKSKDVVGGLMNMANTMKRIPIGVVQVKGDGSDTIRLTMLSADDAVHAGLTSDYFEFISTSHTYADSVAYTESIPATGTDKVDVYPLYSVYQTSELFQVTADGVNVPVIQYRTNTNYSAYDYAAFSLKQQVPITITVTYTANITDYTISPLREGIQGTVSGKTLTFILNDPTYLILTLNGNARRLVIAVDAPEENVPVPGDEGVYNILDYGADATGAKLSTDAMNAAMADAAAYGAEDGHDQGVVYVPAGYYTVSNVELLSNTNLYIAGGAILRIPDDTESLRAMAQKVSIPNTYMTFMLYTEDHGVNISVTGRGTLDGRGAYGRSMGWTVTLLLLRSAEEFHLDGPLFRESGMWAIIPAWSQQSVLEKFKVLNNTSFNEDDCVDVVGGYDVTIRHALGISNDDTFSTKTYIMNEGANVSGYGTGPALDLNGVTFEDCIAWSHCYGYKSGQGFAMEQQNLMVQDSVVYDCAVGFGIHHHQNGDAEPHDIYDVVYRNLDVENITHNIWTNSCFATFYIELKGNHTTTAGNIHDITVQDILVRCPNNSPCMLQGGDWNGQWRVDNVTFENIVIDGVQCTSLTQMGFTGTTPSSHWANGGVDRINNSTGCTLINSANTKLPARYYETAANASAVADASAENGTVVRASGEASLEYPFLYLGNRIDSLKLSAKAPAGGTIRVALDDPAAEVGTVTLDAVGDYTLYALPMEAESAGIHTVYLTLSDGVSLDYLQPHTDITVESVAALLATLPEDTALEGDALEEAATLVETAAAQVAALTETEQGQLEAGLLEGLARKQEILAAGGYSAWYSQTQILLGDLNGDGKLSVTDVVLLRKAILAGSPADEVPAGDLNGDGSLSVTDVVLLRKVILAGDAT